MKQKSVMEYIYLYLNALYSFSLANCIYLPAVLNRENIEAFDSIVMFLYNTIAHCKNAVIFTLCNFELISKNFTDPLQQT